MPTPQPDLFDVGERQPERCKATCTPAPIGSGPEGETCRTCRHLARLAYRTRNYLKCGVMEVYWTHGAGTDIKAKYPACSWWEPKPVGDQQEPTKGKSQPDTGDKP